MTILVVRSDGSVIEMPDSAEHLHAQLHYENQAKAVDKRLMRTYQVKPTQGGLYLTELPHAEKPSPSQATVLISTVKLPMNK